MAPVENVKADPTAEGLIKLELLLDWGDRLRGPHFVRVLAMPGAAEEEIQFQVSRTLGEGGMGPSREFRSRPHLKRAYACVNLN